MIKEWWQYWTTPVHIPEARKMGFLHEAIAMAARRERCFSAWQSHYQKCQQAILHLAKACHSQDCLVILGAGSLQDIPLPRLSSQFKKVLLVDIVFLKESRDYAKRYPNVELHEIEITGWVAPIYQRRLVRPSRIKSTLVKIAQNLGKTDPEFFEHAKIPSPAVQLAKIWAENTVSAVVSLNLFTQIPLIPVRWLIEKAQLPEQLAGEVGTMIVKQHLDFLQQQSCPVCLIADREDIEVNQAGEVLDSWDPTWDVPLPEPETQWQWWVMPIGEYDRQKGQQNRVGVNYFHLDGGVKGFK